LDGDDLEAGEAQQIEGLAVARGVVEVGQQDDEPAPVALVPRQEGARRGRERGAPRRPDGLEEASAAPIWAARSSLGGAPTPIDALVSTSTSIARSSSSSKRRTSRRSMRP